MESPEHGFIHGQQFWEGEHVSFSCRPGYWLDGSAELHCLRNGTWTESKPKCIIGKLIEIIHNRKIVIMCLGEMYHLKLDVCVLCR